MMTFTLKNPVAKKITFLVGMCLVIGLYIFTLNLFQNAQAATIATTYTSDQSVILASSSASPGPGPAPSNGDFTKLSAGNFSSINSFLCFIADDSQIYCSGDNEDYALGIGNANDEIYSPVRFGSGLTGAAATDFNSLKFVQVSVAGDSVFGGRTCGLTSVNTIYCAGRNPNGELATGNTSAKPNPTLFGDGTKLFTQVSTANSYTCALTTDQKIYCAGSNGYGQLGANLGAGDYYTLQQFGGTLTPPKSFIKVSAGYRHACGLTTTSEIYCAGINTSGELGDGTYIDRSAPVKFGTNLAPSKTFLLVSAGVKATCAITTDQQVLCSGDNSVGQLGGGSIVPKSSDPLRFGNSTGPAVGKSFTQVSSGGSSGSTGNRHHTCALSTEKLIYCAGRNDSYQLGYSASTADQRNPVLFGGVTPPTVGRTYVHVATSSNFTCAWGVDNFVYCSGDNDSGQQGIGNTSSRTYPDISMQLP